MRRTETFILTRSAATERRVEQRLALSAGLITVSAVALCFATIYMPTTDTSADTGFRIAYLFGTVTVAAGAAGQWWLAVIQRGLRGLYVTFTHDGVTYSCAEGSFSVPWNAVRSVRVAAKGRVLRIHARGWGGPIGNWVRLNRLDFSSDSWPGDLEAAVHHFSNGTHSLAD